MIFDPATLPPRLDFVGREFPFPLALTYTRVWQEIDAGQPIPAVLQMKDAFEAYLKFCASVAVADALAAGPPPELAAKLVGTLFKPLATGDWFTVLEDALRPVRTAPPARRVLPALADVIFKPNGDRTEVGLILIGTNTRVGFVKWRNSELAHGAFRRDRGFYADQIAKWLPQLNRCLEALRPVLAGCELRGVTPEGGRVDWTGDQALPKVEHHRHEAWGEPLPLSLELADGRSLPLGPLLSMQSCRHPACRQPSAFFFEGNEYAKEKHKTYFLEYFVGQTQTAKDWPPVRDLAAHLPEKFVFERTSYDHRKLAEDVKLVFRDVDREYRRPDYLLDGFWDARDAHPTGYYLWEGEQGVGKSFVAHGLERDGDDRGVTVLRYHVLPGAAAAYQTFIGELGQRVRDKLQFATQEIQALVSRHAELPKQFAGFVAEVMRANNLSGLVVVIDGLDELRDPEKPSGAVLTDFLPPLAELPRGCVVALTARPAMCGRVRERLAAIGLGARPDAIRCAIVPAGDPNRELVRHYLREQEAEVLRSAAAVERVLELSGGVFLYAVHFARALAAGAYAAVDDLPEAGRFYADYLGRLRERVGDSLYETVYEKALMLLVAARVPVTRAELHRWGVPADRLTFALRDVADFVRELRHRGWHEGIGDSDEPRYAIAHEAFVRYATTDAGMSDKLRAAHRTIAEVALARNETRWENLDAADPADLYDLRFVIFHAHAAGCPEPDESLAQALGTCFTKLFKSGRYVLAAELSEKRAKLLLPRKATTELKSYVEALVDQATALFNLGRAAAAGAVAGEALALLDPADVTVPLEVLIRLLGVRAGTLVSAGHLKEAVECHTRGLDAVRKKLAVTSPNTAEHREAAPFLSHALSNHAYIAMSLGDYSAATAYLNESIDLLEQLDADPNDSYSHLTHAVACVNLGVCLTRQARELNHGGNVLDADVSLRAAVGLFEKGRTIMRDRLDPQQQEVNVDITATLLEKQGDALSLLGNIQPGKVTTSGTYDAKKSSLLQRAVTCYESAAAILLHRIRDAGRAELRMRFAYCLIGQGCAYLALGRLPESRGHLEEAVLILRDLSHGSEAPESLDGLGGALINLGQTHEEATQADEAARCYEQAIDIFRRLFDGGSHTYLRSLLWACVYRCELAISLENWPAAITAAACGWAAATRKQTAAPLTDEERDRLDVLTGNVDMNADELEAHLPVVPVSAAEAIRQILDREN